MAFIQVRDMDSSDEYFVSACSHINESEEMDTAAAKRLVWIKKMYSRGMRVKVARLGDDRVGFLYLMPIDICPWGPIGRDLMVIPCLYVMEKGQHKKAGQSLLKAAEAEARLQGFKGMVVTAYYHDFWFMPAGFFEKFGFEVAASEKNTALIWRVFDEKVKPPRFLKRKYKFKSVPGKVVVDLFHHTFCMTVCQEAERVREVAAEFADKVIFNEYSADDPEILRKYQTPRAIFINGKEISWGYEAPREGIREAITEALKNV
nr:GNAT family N-acetyltransferase [candidate division Zixibacteria bacterium]